jgi:predicted DNA-binding protein
MMKRTNYHFPEQMMLRLKEAKAKTGIPMSEMIRRAIEDYLQKLGL